MTKRNGSAQGAQEPGHLPKAVGQAVPVSGQMNQLHLQPSGAGEVVHGWYQLAASVPFPDVPTDDASWPGGQNHCGCRDDVLAQEVPELKVHLCEQLHLELHP